MQITKEFLQAEISELESEMQKAQTFVIQAQATIAAYKMLINRLEAPEQETEKPNELQQS
jgi:hypothetical protein